MRWLSEERFRNGSARSRLKTGRAHACARRQISTSRASEGSELKRAMCNVSSNSRRVLLSDQRATRRKRRRLKSAFSHGNLTTDRACRTESRARTRSRCVHGFNAHFTRVSIDRSALVRPLIFMFRSRPPAFPFSGYADSRPPPSRAGCSLKNYRHHSLQRDLERARPARGIY